MEDKKEEWRIRKLFTKKEEFYVKLYVMSVL